MMHEDDVYNAFLCGVEPFTSNTQGSSDLIHGKASYHRVKDQGEEVAIASFGRLSDDSWVLKLSRSLFRVQAFQRFRHCLRSAAPCRTQQG